MQLDSVPCFVCAAPIEPGGGFCVICKHPYTDEIFEVPDTCTCSDRFCDDCDRCTASFCQCPTCTHQECECDDDDCDDCDDCETEACDCENCEH